MSSSERRRALVRYAIAVALAGALAACGFHLRGDVTYAFSTLYINAPPNTPFATDLKRALSGGSTTLTDSAAGAQAILDLSNITDDKQVLSLSGGGRVREYQLIKRVTFALHDATGHDWMPAAEIAPLLVAADTPGVRSGSKRAGWALRDAYWLGVLCLLFSAIEATIVFPLSRNVPSARHAPWTAGLSIGLITAAVIVLVFEAILKCVSARGGMVTPSSVEP